MFVQIHDSCKSDLSNLNHQQIDPITEINHKFLQRHNEDENIRPVTHLSKAKVQQMSEDSYSITLITVHARFNLDLVIIAVLEMMQMQNPK